MSDLLTVLAPLGADAAGLRLHQIRGLGPFLTTGGCLGAIAKSVLGEEARPVRAILFNKSPGANWALGWHQDRTICVRERREAPGFGPWTIKAGMIHVAPPMELLSGMVTLRAHLDDVPATNGPLMFAPGSHLLGRIPEADINGVVAKCGTAMCVADAGDVWLYSTPVLHASEAAASPRSRRVLQVDYAAESLPHGLEWLGI
jgi:ectoine hydroxylase-related dioxygenase (phytanoyl-CoA dioxygenase family)